LSDTVRTQDFPENFVLDIEAVIRVGGSISTEEVDEFELLEAALISARSKYGVHFEGEECCIIRIKIQDSFQTFCLKKIHYLQQK